MSRLSKMHVNALRSRLTTLLELARAEIRQSGAAPPEGEAHPSQSRDETAEMFRQQEVRSIETTIDQRRLAEIEAALAQIERGTYGICTDCGEPIRAERLQAQPWAVRCATCQNLREASWAELKSKR